MVLIIQTKVNNINEALITLSNDYGKLHWLLNKSKGHLRGETFGHLVQVGDQFQKVNNLTLDTTGLGKIQGNTMCVFGPLLTFGKTLAGRDVCRLSSLVQLRMVGSLEFIQV